MFAPQLPAQQLLAHATQLHRNGNFPAAVEVYRQLIRSFPNNAEILDKLGSALAAIGQTVEARQHIEKAIKLAPSQALFHHDLHLTFKREGKWSEAEQALDQALKRSPRHPIYTAAKAELFLLQQDYERAIKTLDPVRGTAGEYPPVAMVFASLAPRIGAEQECAEAIRKLLARDDVTMNTKAKLQFALAFVLDLAGDHAGAWEAARAGNALVGAKWDAAAHRTAIDDTITAWTTSACAAAPKAAVDGSSVVLVVGMPKSGSGLVSQMLAGTEGGAIVGELNDLIFAARDMQGASTGGAPIFNKVATLDEKTLTERATTYLNRLRTLRPEATLFIDRLPMNMLNLGLISRILPGVRVVHMVRNRADVGASCYLSIFSAIFPFAYDLANLGSFVRDADRLMAHWRELPGLPILDVDYDELLARPEATARRLVEFVGKPWRAEVLEPARRWVQTVTLPDGSMRDLLPDGRTGVGKSYAEWMGDYDSALRA